MRSSPLPYIWLAKMKLIQVWSVNQLMVVMPAHRTAATGATHRVRVFQPSTAKKMTTKTHGVAQHAREEDQREDPKAL